MVHDVAGPAGVLFAVRHPRRASRTLHRRGDRGKTPSSGRPVLVLFGADDPFLPPPNAERLAKAFPQATLQLLAGAGRFLQEDAPEEVAERRSAFLS